MMAQQGLDLLNWSALQDEEDDDSFEAIHWYVHSNIERFGTSKIPLTTAGGSPGLSQFLFCEFDEARKVYYDDEFHPGRVVIRVDKDTPIREELGNAFIGCTDSCKCAEQLAFSHHRFVPCANVFCSSYFSTAHFDTCFVLNHTSKMMPLFCHTSCRDSMDWNVGIEGFPGLESEVLTVFGSTTADDLARIIATFSPLDADEVHGDLIYKDQVVSFSGSCSLADALFGYIITENGWDARISQFSQKLGPFLPTYSIADIYMRAVTMKEISEAEHEQVKATLGAFRFVQRQPEPEIDQSSDFFEFHAVAPLPNYVPAPEPLLSSDLIMDLSEDELDGEDDFNLEMELDASPEAQFFARYPRPETNVPFMDRSAEEQWGTQTGSIYKVLNSNFLQYATLPADLRLEADRGSILLDGSRNRKYRLCHFSAFPITEWDDATEDVDFLRDAFDILLTRLQDANVSWLKFFVTDLLVIERDGQRVLVLSPLARLKAHTNSSKWVKKVRQSFERMIGRHVSAKRRKRN